jgi:hypothetical protein
MLLKRNRCNVAWNVGEREEVEGVTDHGRGLPLDMSSGENATITTNFVAKFQSHKAIESVDDRERRKGKRRLTTPYMVRQQRFESVWVSEHCRRTFGRRSDTRRYDNDSSLMSAINVARESSKGRRWPID